MESVKQNLIAAKANIEDFDKWGRVNLIDSAGCMCLLGTIAKAKGVFVSYSIADGYQTANGQTLLDGDIFSKLRDTPEVNATANAIKALHPRFISNTSWDDIDIIWRFNDHHRCRSNRKRHAEVLAVLDYAAAQQ